MLNLFRLPNAGAANKLQLSQNDRLGFAKTL